MKEVTARNAVAEVNFAVSIEPEHTHGSLKLSK